MDVPDTPDEAASSLSEAVLPEPSEPACPDGEPGNAASGPPADDLLAFMGEAAPRAMASPRARLRDVLRYLPDTPEAEAERAADGDGRSALIDALAWLDAAGFLAGPGEAVHDLRARGLLLCDRLDRLDRELAEGPITGFGGMILPLAETDRIDPELIRNAGAVTERLYGFRLEWAPGFFWTIPRWRMWGGCAWGDPDEGLALFLLRREFAGRERFFIYGRGEILSHELCHVARWPFGGGDRLEEFHAYQTSTQRLRRYLGNCFTTTLDGLLFAVPAMLLAATQAFRVATDGMWSMELFWGLAVAGPAWLLLKNHAARQRYFAARDNLRRLGVTRPEAVLFRGAWEELPLLATLPDREALAGFATRDWRWRATARRFLASEKT